MGFGIIRAAHLHSILRSAVSRVSLSSGGVLPMMAYTGRLRPKGVPFSGFRYAKGRVIHKLRFTKGQGNQSVRYIKGF